MAETSGAVVTMERVEVAGEPVGDRVLGLKPQVVSAGSPLQARLTVESKPLIGVAVKVNVAVPPGETEAVAGVIETLKSGGGALTT